MAQQIKKKFIAPDAIDGSKIKLQEGEALRLQTPGGVVELLKKDADGNLVSEGNEISFKADMETAVSTEESARIAAVSAEASARMAADESLEVKIDFITSNIDGDAIDSLTEMLSAFQSADSDLNNAISQLAGAAGGNLSAEIVARESAISAEASAREVAISAEIAARESADDSLESALSVETAARESALSVEIAARESADLSLESDLDAEISAREAAVSAEIVARESAMSVEVAARESADEDLQDQIDTEKGRIDAILLAADADKDSFAEIVSLINSVDTENDNAFASAVLSLQSADSAEASVRAAAISAEIAARESADDSLESALSVEIAARESADLSLESDLDAEISAREAAVSAEASARDAEDLTFFKKDGSREMTGSIIPSVDVSFDLGSSSKRFRDIYLSGNTIDLGGVTLSNESSEFVVRDASNNELAIVSDNVREGLVNKFFTESRVQETEMSMLDVTKSGEVASTDSLIDAVSKLQSQITLEISDREDDVDAEESARMAADDLLDGRLDVIEALAFEKESFTLGVNPTGVTLAHSPKAKSTVMFVGRLALHEGLDYSISGNIVTFIGDFAHNSEDEIAAAEGDVVKVTYYY